MHLTGWELFELPNQHQFLFLGLNGLVGTVLCELIWLWACFLTSPLQATLALSFINPGSILVNYVSLLSKNCLFRHFKLNLRKFQFINGVYFGSRFLMGAGLNAVGFLGITLMNSGVRKKRPRGVYGIELDER